MAFQVMTLARGGALTQSTHNRPYHPTSWKTARPHLNSQIRVPPVPPTPVPSAPACRLTALPSIPCPLQCYRNCWSLMCFNSTDLRNCEHLLGKKLDSARCFELPGLPPEHQVGAARQHGARVVTLEVRRLGQQQVGSE